MIARQPYLPRFMAGGPGNPLGARAIYLGGTLYRIHGTNAPSTIGKRVSSGCIRMLNEDVIDLYCARGTPAPAWLCCRRTRRIAARRSRAARRRRRSARPVAMTRLPGREAMNLSGASIY